MKKVYVELIIGIFWSRTDQNSKDVDKQNRWNGSPNKKHKKVLKNGWSLFSET